MCLPAGQGKEEVFHFLETVLLEVLALFPSSYIHIGGDEARPDARHTGPPWKGCAIVHVPKKWAPATTSRLHSTVQMT